MPFSPVRTARPPTRPQDRPPARPFTHLFIHPSNPVPLPAVPHSTIRIPSARPSMYRCPPAHWPARQDACPSTRPPPACLPVCPLPVCPICMSVSQSIRYRTLSRVSSRVSPTSAHRVAETDGPLTGVAVVAGVALTSPCLRVAVTVPVAQPLVVVRAGRVLTQRTGEGIACANTTFNTIFNTIVVHLTLS